MDSNFEGPVNIGSTEMVTINDLTRIVAEISQRQISLKHIPGPEGVRGRNSNNALIKEKLVWEPRVSLLEGMRITYAWVCEQMRVAEDVA